MTEATSLCGRERDDDLAVCALVCLPSSGEAGIVAGACCYRLFDGLHRLLCVQHGTHRVDPCLRGLSAAGARPRSGGGDTLLPHVELPCIDHLFIPYQKRKYPPLPPDPLSFFF